MLRNIKTMSAPNDGSRSLEASIMSPEVIRAFEDWKVATAISSFVLIRGMAFSFHARSRFTQDIDVLFLNEHEVPTAVEGFKKTRALVRKPFIPIRADILYQAMLALRAQAQSDYEKDETDGLLSKEDTEAWRHAEIIEEAIRLNRSTASDPPESKEDEDAYLFVCSSPPGTSICYASLDPFGREYLSRTGRTENPWHKVTRQDLVTRGEPKIIYQAKPEDKQP